jgi:Arc/MetJ family transcription regulator
MSKRLQVVMTEEEYEEIRAVADRRRVTVSEWVRHTLRDARERDGRHAGMIARETGAEYGARAPTFPRRIPVQMEIKEDLLEAVRQRYRLPTARAAVEFALRRVAIKPMTKEEALAMRGVGWEGDLDEMRSGDPGGLW